MSASRANRTHCVAKGTTPLPAWQFYTDIGRGRKGVVVGFLSYRGGKSVDAMPGAIFGRSISAGHVVFAAKPKLLRVTSPLVSPGQDLACYVSLQKLRKYSNASPRRTLFWLQVSVGLFPRHPTAEFSGRPQPIEMDVAIGVKINSFRIGPNPKAFAAPGDNRLEIERAGMLWWRLSLKTLRSCAEPVTLGKKGKTVNTEDYLSSLWHNFGLEIERQVL